MKIIQEEFNSIRDIEYEICVNSQGVYKIMINWYGKWRYMKESDYKAVFMTASTVLPDTIFFSKEDVAEFINDYIIPKSLEVDTLETINEDFIIVEKNSVLT